MQSPSDDPLNDDVGLESLLQLSDTASPTDDLRGSLLEQTTVALRNHRRRRRAALGLGFATAYAAGLLTALGVSASRPPVAPATQVSDRPAQVRPEYDPPEVAPSRTAHVAEADNSVEASVTAQPQTQWPAHATGLAPKPAHPRVAAFSHRTRPVTPPARGANRDPQRTSYESLRELGDHYLLQRGDPEGAIRCYRLAWKSATDDERDTQTGTWLYRALVRDLETEQTHERQDG